VQEVFVGPSRLAGRVTPPPSKSMAHRVLIGAALAGISLGELERWGITGELGGDIQATRSCLQALLAPGGEPAVLDCRESGSTLRFLLPVAAALGRRALFVGAETLARRPLRDYVSILGERGVRLTFPGEANLPVQVEGRLQAGVFQVPGHITSQYITGLLLALPLVAGKSTIQLTSPLQSAPYVELTQAVLAQFGVAVETISQGDGTPAGWRVSGQQRYRVPQRPVALEADFSQGAFWLVAAFLGHGVEVQGLTPQSLQGDRAIVALLAELAAAAPGEELPISAAQTPDLVPILAVAACSRPGVTIIEDAQRLRFKESDRLLSTSAMLNSLGGSVEVRGGSLFIHGGGQLAGGTVQAQGDHRIAMAAAIAALNSQNGVRIVGSDAVAKSYPHFFQELKRLGGDVRGI